MIAEPFALHRALQEIDFRNGIKAFFEHETESARKKCCEMMKYPPKIESAIGQAAVAQACEEMLNKLESFVKDQLERQ